LGLNVILDLAGFSRKFLSGPSLFIENEKTPGRHPLDCWLKYINFVKTGQPKLSEGDGGW
jgi:hypothetical protein